MAALRSHRLTEILVGLGIVAIPIARVIRLEAVVLLPIWMALIAFSLAIEYAKDGTGSKLLLCRELSSQNGELFHLNRRLVRPALVALGAAALLQAGEVNPSWLLGWFAAVLFSGCAISIILVAVHLLRPGKNQASR